MVHSGYHPLKHRPLRVVFGWCTVDIVLLGQYLDGAQWISSSETSVSQDSAWMVHSGYHPLKHRPLRIVLGWCTVDIILLNIVLLGQCLDGAQWTSSSQDNVWMVHSGYHPLKHRPLLEGAQWISSSETSVSQDSVWMVHSGYHPLKHRPLRIVLGWCTVDIILLNIVLLGQCLDGAQWISSS